MTSIKEFEDGVTVRTVNHKGKGLFAARNFAKDEIVFVAYGPITSTCSAYTIPVDYNLFLNPITFNSLARYLNHSCNPNCGIRNRTEIVAMRDIEEGEEIVIDYAMLVYDYTYYGWTKPIKCECGSESCRGEFGSWLKLPPELKEKYKEYASDFLFEEPPEGGFQGEKDEENY